MFYILILESKRFLLIQRADWIENNTVGEKSLIFYSNDENSMPDFTAPKRFLLDEKSNATYDGFLVATRGECSFNLEMVRMFV